MLNAPIPGQPIEPDVLLMSEVDEEVFKAGKFLLLRDQNMSMEKIAEQFGVTRKTIYTWLAQWTATGAIEKARNILLTPKYEDMRAAHQIVLAQYQNMLQRLVKEALYGKSGKTALEIFAYLKANIVDFELAGIEEPGAAESQYAKRPTDLSPTIISQPKFLRKPD